MQSSIISARVTSAFIAVLVILVLAFVASVHSASRLAELDGAAARSRDVLTEASVTRVILHELESARQNNVCGWYRCHRPICASPRVMDSFWASAAQAWNRYLMPFANSALC